MMLVATSYVWDSLSSLSRRLVALGIISEMKAAIEQLEALNQKLDFELSVEDADINFELWFNDTFSNQIQPLFQGSSFMEGDEDNSMINKMTDLFPIGKSPTLNERTIDSLKTGMRQIGSEGVLNHSDIGKALISGFGTITTLLREIKEKMTEIPDELYENFCIEHLAQDLDLAFQEAEQKYKLWKVDHEWESLQALEDKRTQEIVKLLQGNFVSYSTMPTNREISECSLKIQREALEHNTQLPDNIDIECARFSKFVFMKDRIMWIDYAKLGKYLYRHYKEITFKEKLSLKIFVNTLDFIHQDMAEIDPQLKVYLPEYENNKLEAVLVNAINIINTCKPFLYEKMDEGFLENYLRSAYYGGISQEVQKLLARKAIYTHICKMIGMLKASMKVFKVGTSSEQLASCISPLTEKPNKDSMIRKIDEGAADINSNLRHWTDAYIKDHCYTVAERVFVGLSQK